MFARIGEDRYPLRLAKEPNSFEQDLGGQLEGSGSQVFIMDGVAESDIATTENIFTAGQYNSDITLIIEDGFDGTEFEVAVQAYTDFQKPRKFPLNGRLSGNWVVEGVPDQGFVISFNEFVDGNGARNQMFLSWYTYNTDGSNLWLVADTFHDTAEDSVDLNIQLVTSGEFMANVQADRSDVGSATLTAENCNEMTLEYNLESLGLGSGTVTLVRIFSVEMAGFACRDQQSRIDAL